MLILALDSTAVVASVALCRDETPVASFHVKNGNTHSETLLPMVETVLKTAGFSINDVDLFACSVGPGSFTGVRIGVATIKGLAFGKNKPCIGISTLEALALNAMPFDGIVCPVMNARRGQVYNALFRCENGSLTRLCPDRALSVLELDAELAEKGEPYALVGDGIEEMTRVASKTTAECISPLLTDQNAISVAKCAYRAFLSGQNGVDAELKPVYLRLPQAERERLAKLNENK